MGQEKRRGRNGLECVRLLLVRRRVSRLYGDDVAMHRGKESKKIGGDLSFVLRIWDSCMVVELTHRHVKRVGQGATHLVMCRRIAGYYHKPDQSSLQR